MMDAAGASEIKSLQPDEAVLVAAEESPQPSEAGRGGGCGFAAATGTDTAGEAQGSEESDNKSPQPLDAVEVVVGGAASPQPLDPEMGIENDLDPQSDDTGIEEDEVSASMSSMLKFGLGADGTGGKAFLDGFVLAGSGGGAATTGGTGSGGRTRG